MNSKNLRNIVLFILLGGLFFSGCQKLEIERELKIESDSVFDIKTRSAIARATIKDVGSGIVSYGHLWDTVPELSLTSSKTEYSELITPGSYESKLKNLVAGINYFTCPYVTTNDEFILGEMTSIHTKTPSLADISSVSIKSQILLDYVFESKINFLGFGSDSILHYGHCWSNNEMPSISNEKTDLGRLFDTTTFVSNALLANNRKYYVRAYTITELGIAYSKQLIFNTENYAPIIYASVDSSSISSETATIYIDYFNAHNLEIIEKGLLITFDTLYDNFDFSNRIVSTSNISSFSCHKTRMFASTKHYFKAYLQTNIGFFYSDLGIFLTEPPTLATLEHFDYQIISSSSVFTTVRAKSDGGGNIEHMGVCWSQTSPPTIDDNTIYGPDYGFTYNYNITDLTPELTYFFRPFAINEVGISYGIEIELTLPAHDPE